MFSTVEKYRGPAKILLGLIALTFVGFGAGGIIAAGSDYIVKVGGEKISTQSVQQAQREEKLGSPQDALTVLTERAFLTEGAKMMGIAVSDAQLKQVIVDDPGFHDENGRFNETKFRNFLQQSGMNEEQFLNTLRRQFQLQNLVNLAANGNIVTDAQYTRYAETVLADRTVRTVILDPKNFAAQVKTDDAALKAYYDKDKSKYVRPQAVKFQYIELSADALADKQTVGEDEVKKAFDERQKAAGAQREVSHIMFKAAAADKAAVKAEAEKVLAEAKAAPDTFADLARKYSQDEGTAQSGGSLGAIGKDTPLPEAFKTAVAKLGKGATELVETDEGFHIVHIDNLGGSESFDEAKAQIEAELKRQKARQALAKTREILQQAAFDSPDSLKAAAEKTGLPVKEGGEWLTKDKAQQAQLPADLVEALFGDEVFKKKHNSDPIAVGEGYWVVRASETREESTPSFEQAKEEVRAAYLNSESAKAAQEQGKKLLAELQKGGKPDLAWSPVETLSAADARMRLPPHALAALAKARPAEGKPAYVLLEGLPVPVLMEVQSVTVPQASAEEKTLVRKQIAQQSAVRMYSSLLDYLKSKIELKQGHQKLESSGQ